MTRFILLIPVIIAFLVIVTAVSLASNISDYSFPVVNWYTFVNVTGTHDILTSACPIGDRVAVFGGAGLEYNETENTYYYGNLFAALLDIHTGRIIREWYPGTQGVLDDCVTLAGKIYAVGWSGGDNGYGAVIYVFDKSLTPLESRQLAAVIDYRAIATNGEHLYIAGEAERDINSDGYDETVWYIAEYTPDLKMVSHRVFYTGNWDTGYVTSILYNSYDGTVWVAGYYTDTKGNTHGLILVMDSSLSPVRIIDLMPNNSYYIGRIYSLCTDCQGFVYAAGDNGVIKIRPGGMIIAHTGYASGSKIICLGRRIYALDQSNNGPEVYLLGEDLQHVNSENLYLSSNGEFSFIVNGKASIGCNKAYVAGIYLYKGSTSGVVYSLSIPATTCAIITNATTTYTIFKTLTRTYTSVTTHLITLTKHYTVFRTLTITSMKEYTSTITTVSWFTWTKMVTVTETVTYTSVSTISATTTKTATKMVTVIVRNRSAEEQGLVIGAFLGLAVAFVVLAPRRH